MEQPYKDFTQYLNWKFPEYKVQKISLNSGFSCPNRDGSKGRGGCTYCNNSAFSPKYTQTERSIKNQITAGKAFFQRKYPNMKYIAYFQSYTNTYGEIEQIKKLYKEALSCDDIVGITIGTRPDCISDELLDYLSRLNNKHYIYIEYGVESTSNSTLKRINRHHTYEESVEAIEKTAQRGIPVGAHLIIGLPGEQNEDYINHIRRLSKLPLTSLKMHQLQILKNTAMAIEYRQNPKPYKLFTIKEYLETVGQLLRNMRPTIYLDRFTSQAPSELLIAPKWGIKNYQFVSQLQEYMRHNGWKQGDLYINDSI